MSSIVEAGVWDTLEESWARVTGAGRVGWPAVFVAEADCLGRAVVF